MGFSNKIRKEFSDRGMTNRDISKAMDNYSESMISKHMSADKISRTFIEKIAKYFPEIDINALIKEEDGSNKTVGDQEEYRKRNQKLISQIRSHLNELEMNLSRS